MNKYAAQVEEGIVVQVIVGNPEWASSQLGGQWHGINSKVGIGWSYDNADGFRPLRPYPSWKWEDGQWTAPVPYPDDDSRYIWDEESQAWATVDLIGEQGDD